MSVPHTPASCTYCDGEANSSAGGSCGFCEAGIAVTPAARAVLERKARIHAAMREARQQLHKGDPK